MHRWGPMAKALALGALAFAIIVHVSAPLAAKETRLSDRLFFVKGKPGTATEFQMIVRAGCSDEEKADCRGRANYVEHRVLVGRNAEHRETARSSVHDATANS